VNKKTREKEADREEEERRGEENPKTPHHIEMSF
jgi:hypothetical protein